MSGLALVLTQFVPVSVSMMTLILNGVCLIAGIPADRKRVWR